jgi:adenylosuccinate lyase
MEANLNRLKGLVNSQRVLLALTQAGLSREDSYKAVQRNAMQVWEAGKDFQTLLKEDKEIAAHLSAAEIDDMFDMNYHVKHVDTIFARVFPG